MRRLSIVAMALAACGRRTSEHDARAVTSDARPATVASGRLPAATASPAGEVPAGLVLIDGDGSLWAGAAPATWPEAIAPEAKRGLARVGTAADVPAALLAVLVREDGTVGDQARELADERATAGGVDGGTPSPGDGGEPETAEVEMTYAATADDAIPTATPLVIAQPHAPAGRLVDVLALTGGVLAIDDHGKVGLFQRAFPWTHGDWGGAADPEVAGRAGEDVEALDARLEPGHLVLVYDGNELATFALPVVAGQLAPVLARYRQAADAMPDQVVVDVLVGGADVQAVLDVIAALDDAGAKWVGVARDPFVKR